MRSANVNAVLFFSLTISMSETSWGYAALSGYLYDVGHSNAKVGFAEGLQGMAQLFAALVAGEIADRVSRRRPLRLGIALGIVAIVMLWIAMFAPFATTSDEREYLVATIGLFLWGSFRGVTLAPVDALFADSVSTAKRAKYQTRKYVATLLGATMGPLLAVTLFAFFGDEWTRNELRVVIAAGTAFAIVPLISLLRLHDKHALDVAESGPLLNLEEEKDDTKAFKVRMLCFAADLLGGLASGMTIRFFPLFFRDKTELSPGQVNWVTMSTTLVMILGSTISQKMSGVVGRMPVILFYKITGISLLFLMALKKDLWADWRIIVPIYILRTVLMNSTSPLHKSILMDYCGKEKRARYSALDSVVSFGWSGSALLGGILADKHGFGYTFLITAIVQFIGFLFLVALAFVVDDKRHSLLSAYATVAPAENADPSAVIPGSSSEMPEGAADVGQALLRGMGLEASDDERDDDGEDDDEEVTEEYRPISDLENAAG